MKRHDFLKAAAHIFGVNAIRREGQYSPKIETHGSGVDAAGINVRVSYEVRF